MRILVLAADAKERSLIENALGKSRHNIFTASTLAEALQLAESQKPRLAIVDDDVPDSDRAEFVARMRAAGRLPVYILSVATPTDNPLDSDDSLRKPFTAVELA